MKWYTGTRECGCLVAAISEEVNEEELKKTLEEYKELGYKIGKMDVEEVRNKLKECNH